MLSIFLPRLIISELQSSLRFVVSWGRSPVPATTQRTYQTHGPMDCPFTECYPDCCPCWFSEPYEHNAKRPPSCYARWPSAMGSSIWCSYGLDNEVHRRGHANRSGSHIRSHLPSESERRVDVIFMWVTLHYLTLIVSNSAAKIRKIFEPAKIFRKILANIVRILYFCT